MMANNSNNSSSSSRSDSNKTVTGSYPCGNPKRYTSADVVQMRTNDRKRQTESGSQDDVDQTESDQYLQILLKRQIDTDISLKKQFSQHRSFASSSSHAPIVNKLDGLHSLDEHVQLDQLDSRIDYLKSCGLTSKEIAFKLKHDLSNENASSGCRGFGADPDSEKSLVEEIEKKLAQKEEVLKKPDRFNGGLQLSRQALVLEKAILDRQSKEASLPEFLFQQKRVDSTQPDDPINHIPDILAAIEPRPTRDCRRERRRKRKLNQKLLRQQKYLGVDENPVARKEFMQSVGLAYESHSDDSCSEKEIETEDVCVSDNESKSNAKDSLKCEDSVLPSEDEVKGKASSEDEVKGKASSEDEVKGKASSDEGHGPSVKKKKKKKSVCKSAVIFMVPEFLNNVALLTDEQICSNKLTLQEILSLDRFEKYEQGNPNQTIFVKNLPTDVTEMDIVSMFGRFQERHAPTISFRLLNGRMKGQAFITFSDVSTASAAISKLNGYKLRGKPMILSFGKKDNNGHTQINS